MQGLKPAAIESSEAFLAAHQVQGCAPLAARLAQAEHAAGELEPELQRAAIRLGREFAPVQATGDQFHVDEDGYYWYHGRTDDMLKVSGVYVAPAEIENCLLQYEAVLECAVVGHESEGLVKPKAFVVVREGYEAGDQLAEAIKQFVKDRIAMYKYPRWVEFVSSLPKNDRGKIDRKKLKA
jgi:acyl-coenzyme A synthetase/AMP-(fatty) acid ligase